MIQLKFYLYLFTRDNIENFCTAATTTPPLMIIIIFSCVFTYLYTFASCCYYCLIWINKIMCELSICVCMLNNNNNTKQDYKNKISLLDKFSLKNSSLV